MASSATTTISPPSSISRDGESLVSIEKNLCSFIFSRPFNQFSNLIPKSAADRVITNLAKFSLHYALFIWTALFISLIWTSHKVVNIYDVVSLVAITQIPVLYFVLLRIFPDQLFVFRKGNDKQSLSFLAFIILFLFLLIATLEVILIQGEAYNFLAVAATIPIIGLHAVLSKVEDVEVVEERGGSDQPETLV